jgi:Flp pilus assembly protein CpaB
MRSWYWRRRGLGRLVATVTLALAAGTITAGVVARANELADAYGSRQSVPVAVRDLEVGAEIGSGDFAWQARPLALVGGSPVDEPVGRVVAAVILAGEAIVTERVAPDGLRGPMAVAPADTRAIAIPTTEGGRPPVAVGDRVDVMAVALEGSNRAQRVASSSVVVAVSDEAVTVAVESDELAATARAALEATAVIALVGAG